MGLLSKRLQELGIILPEAPKAVAAYVPARVAGSLCFTSGQLPFREGKLVAEGKVGENVSLEDAQQAARQAALNAISVAAAAVGDLDRLEAVIKVVGFVQSTPEFHDQPQVINGASWVLEEIFQENGRHARSAVGTNALPLNAAVEVECIFLIRE
ncbi:RidA family protein [Sulfobacillus thermosulfidooxidans]|uniref:RidA family protein n=1 Tax=Sulfobacillus thermosulfidooxidans TaxID=28034 RepID=UPI0006B42D61|nr:RidA family protein [Sulfobacillus thermosulfidooxidans]